MITPRSSIPEIVWPAIPAPTGAALLALQFQYEQSQWWSPAQIQDHQFRQLNRLLCHAYETVPYYRECLDGAGANPKQPLTAERWAQIPLLSRETALARHDDLLSRRIPSKHGATFEKKTSGSTGQPLKITDTKVDYIFWLAVTLRDHLWHKRDFGGRLVVIRSGRYAKDPLAVQDHPDWGPPASLVCATGPVTMFYHLTPVDRQAQLLQSRKPQYLLTFPSNALVLAQYFREHGLTLPTLRQIRTYGEPIADDVRSACRDVWGVPVSDGYTAEEVGYIALQCPEYEHYHVQAESVLVEILDDEERPCSPGQVGKVVVTPMHNFAMPLLRYVIEDYAEVGAPCPCGRGLPVLKRILGRERNLATLPDGRRFWPSFPAEVWTKIAGIKQIQLIQRSVDHIEVRLAAPQPLEPSDENQLTKALNDALGHSFRLSSRRLDHIPRHPNGKYESFISEIVPNHPPRTTKKDA